MKTAAVIGFTLANALLAHAQTDAGPTPSRFDGSWVVRISCPSHTEASAAKGYSYNFPATVSGGVIVGRYRAEGDVPSLGIEGAIQPNGSAVLHAHGRTGEREYAVKHPSVGTPYKYTIHAQFDTRRGTGSRVEDRVCDFVFTRK